MLIYIQIGNYRSVYSTELDNLKKVNILFGRNNSGKSTILQGIYGCLNNIQKFPKRPWTIDGPIRHWNHQEDGIFFLCKDDKLGDLSLQGNDDTLDNMGGPVIDRPVILKNWARGIYYIKSDRGAFNKDRTMGNGKSPTVGMSGEYANKNLVYIKQNDEKTFDKIRSFIDSLGFDAHTIDNIVNAPNSIDLMYTDTQLNGRFAMNMGGWGLNQIIPLVVQAYDCPPGSILLFEEPEISLHPGAQRELLVQLISLAKEENKQFILTSHSSYYLDTLERWAQSDKANEQECLNEISIYQVLRDGGYSQAAGIDPKEIRRGMMDFFAR